MSPSIAPQKEPLQMPSPASVDPNIKRLNKMLALHEHQFSEMNKALIKTQVSLDEAMEEIGSLRKSKLTEEDAALILSALEGRTDPDASLIRAKLTRT